jgi:hypothetical protein
MEMVRPGEIKNHKNPERAKYLNTGCSPVNLQVIMDKALVSERVR